MPSASRSPTTIWASELLGTVVRSFRAGWSTIARETSGKKSVSRSACAVEAGARFASERFFAFVGRVGFQVGDFELGFDQS